MVLRLVVLAVIATITVARVPDYFNDHPTFHINEEIDDDSELVFLQAVWRHGDRMPTSGFKIDEKKWDYPWGQLTPKGMEQHVTLGGKLRQRYIEKLEFLPKRYNSQDIYVRSTDVNRTLISAISNMIGFYGPNTVEGVDYPKGINWPAQFVPVPVHTVDNPSDFVGNPSSKPCPRKEAIQKLIATTPEATATEKDATALLDEISKALGIKITVRNLWMVYDYLYIGKIHDHTLPGITDEIYKKIEDLSNILDNYQFGIGIKDYKGFKVSQETAKVIGGPLLTDIINNINLKITCEEAKKKNDPKLQRGCGWASPLKYYAYSAHDTTLAALFSAFGFPGSNYQTPGFPHYSTAVTIELRRKDDKYHINVLYFPPEKNGQEVYQEVTAGVSGCSKQCPLETFIKRSEPYLVKDIQSLCKETKLTSTKSAFGLTVSSALLALMAYFARIF